MTTRNDGSYIRVFTVYRSKGFDKSYAKMYFLLNLSHFVKSYGHLCYVLACFTMTTHRIRSSHVTQVVNLENFLFYPNFALNFTNSHKIPGVKFTTSEVTSKNPRGRLTPQCF